MKNKLKIFCILCLITFMSGCVKYNFKMEVGKDNSFTFAITSALDKSMMEQMGQGDSSVLDEEEVATIKAKGFTLEDYAEDNWTGYIVTKKFANIDDISASEPVTVQLNDILDAEKEDIKNYFQKDGDTYKADFLVDLTDDSEEDTETEGETTEETDPETEQYMQQFIDSMDLKYEVTLPEKPVSNNATSVSEDGKTLTWNLEYGKVNEVKFEFKKYVDPAKENAETTNNKTDNKEDKKDGKDNNVILYVGIGVGVVAVIIVIVLLLKKKKTPPTNSGTLFDNSTNLNPTNDTTNNNPTTNVEPVAAEPAVPTPPVDQPVSMSNEETLVTTDTVINQPTTTEPVVESTPVEPVAAPTEEQPVVSDTPAITIEEPTVQDSVVNENNTDNTETTNNN